MTSLVAVVGLTFRSNDVQDIDGIFLDLYRGGPGDLPEVRGTDWVVPTLDGQTVGNRRVHRRTIELRGFVRGSGDDEDEQRGDYWDNRITLASWFDPTVTGELVATLPGGSLYSINARNRGGSDGIVYNQIVPAYADVSIVLESVDPEWELTGS